jgi:hypothetical protein
MFLANQAVVTGDWVGGLSETMTTITNVQGMLLMA